MNLLHALEVFQTVCECRSLRGAAIRFGVKPSTVSKEMTRLEDHLGLKVLNRSTHAVSLTAAGEDVLVRARILIGGSEDLRQYCAGRRGHNSGRLSVSAPIVFGQTILSDVLTDFTRLHPQVEVRLTLDNRSVDLTSEGCDIALRYSRHVDDRYISKTVFTDQLVTCASSTYLERAGIPETQDDLRRHRHLILTGDIGGQASSEWCKTHPSHHATSSEMPMRSNDVGVILRWAEAGLGIARLPGFLVAERMRAGFLQKVLPTVSAQSLHMFAVYQQRRAENQPLNSFIAYLIARLEHLAS